MWISSQVFSSSFDDAKEFISSRSSSENASDQEDTLDMGILWNNTQNFAFLIGLIMSTNNVSAR